MRKVVRKSDVVIYRGRRITLLKRILIIDGDEVEREVVNFGEAVAVLPITDDNKVILVEQYRAPINSWILEIPAGKVEPGESPEETARRELEEEIGYKAEQLEKMISIYTTPGYSDEILHMYVAKNLKYVGAKPEDYEVLKPIALTLDEALHRVLLSPIVDAKTLVALLLYIHRYGIRTGFHHHGSAMGTLITYEE